MGSAPDAPGRAFIGTRGWNYPGWRGVFYGDCPQRQWLSFLVKRFNAVEVNATFYRLQRRGTFARWAAQTPPPFRFAIKAYRYLTYVRRLDDPLPAIRLERDRAAGLGDKLAAVLWQLLANAHRDLGRLERFAHALRHGRRVPHAIEFRHPSWFDDEVAACPRMRSLCANTHRDLGRLKRIVRALRHGRRVPHAIEFRHPSWFDDEVAACLRAHEVAVCQSDAADWPLWDIVTARLVYVRLHGRPLTYASGYSPAQLRRWAERVRGWLTEGRQVHVYFDNDALGRAPLDALRLRALLARPAAAAGPSARAPTGAERSAPPRSVPRPGTRPRHQR